MRPTALLLPALLCASQFLHAADPQLLNMVPPDAKVLAGINVDQARNSPLGQFLLAMMPADAGFQQFVAVSGFDPRRDLHEILVAATRPDKAAAQQKLMAEKLRFARRFPEGGGKKLCKAHDVL